VNVLKLFSSLVQTQIIFNFEATKKVRTTNSPPSFVADVGSGIRDSGSEILDPRSGIRDG
jgi:hypothetical protein